MSENPYETPETISIDERSDDSSEFGLLRSSSPVAWVIIGLLSCQIMFFLLSYIGIYAGLGNLNLMGISNWLIVITVCMWTHKSMVNAWVSGNPTPTITAKGVVWWYFTPLANFCMPYVAMRQIWENLFGVKCSKLLLISWWLCWLGMWGFLFLKLVDHNYGVLDHGNIFYGLIAYGATFFRVAAAVLFIMVILKITDGQNCRIKEYRENQHGR